MPTLTQLKEAVAIAEQIEKLQSELASLVGGSGPVVSVTPVSAPVSKTVSGKRFVSAESRAKMAAAQHARWARKNGAAKPAAVAVAPKASGGKKKRVLSPEGRARIVAALKARHAANRKAAGR